MACTCTWTQVLPRELLLDVFSRLPLGALPAVARTCTAWSVLVMEAFAGWLRWRRPAIPCELLPARCALAEDTMQRELAAPLARVARASGCLDWVDAAGSALVVCCAEPAGQDVFTTRISLAALIRSAEGPSSSSSSPLSPPAAAAARVAATEPPVHWVRRRWPFSTLVGGLTGGMVGHSSSRTAFFPPRTDEVVAVDAGYQNILSVGAQTLLLRPPHFVRCRHHGAQSPGPNRQVVHADVLDLSSRRLLRVDVTRMFEAFHREASDGRHVVVQAVSATGAHFVLHGACSDGSKLAVAVRLPSAEGAHTRVVPRLAEGTDRPLQCAAPEGVYAARGEDDGPPALEPTFARRWEPWEPIALLGDQPGERACGDCLLLHPGKLSPPTGDDGARCCLALSVLHADSGNADHLRLRAPQSWSTRPRSFWFATRIMDVVMDHCRSVLAVCLSVPVRDGPRAAAAAAAAASAAQGGAKGAPPADESWPPWAEPGLAAGLVAAVVWAVPCGTPLAVVDLRAAVAQAAGDFDAPRRCSVQALLHPSEPLLVVALSEGGSRGRKYRTLVVDWSSGMVSAQVPRVSSECHTNGHRALNLM